MIRAVLFDFGGVLTETCWDSQMIARITYDTLVSEGVTPPPNFIDIMLQVMDERHKRVLITMREETLEEIVRETLDRCALSITDEIVEKAVENIEEAPFCKLRKETPWVLRSLREMGLKLGIISNAPSPFPRKILQRHGLLEYFDAVIISCEVGYRKPHPKIFELALEELGVKSEEAIFVGDVLEIDIHGAQKLGMITVLMRYGDPDWKRRVHYLKEIIPYDGDPDYEIENLGELLDIVKQLLMRENAREKVQ
ncbi:MAG: HAD family hydrolase [Candidatus Njordarchaeales archaeon]